MSGVLTPLTSADMSVGRQSLSPPSRTKKRVSGGRSTKKHASSHGCRKRVWKACERCRLKKTKCDGESPCKRCRNNGLLCIAGGHKTSEYTPLSKRYEEILENNQQSLIATVQRLYTMVRNNEPWILGEPELNDWGQPVIHNIAEKLGCMHPLLRLPNVFSEVSIEPDEVEARLQRNYECAGRYLIPGIHDDLAIPHFPMSEQTLYSVPYHSLSARNGIQSTVNEQHRQQEMLSIQQSAQLQHYPAIKGPEAAPFDWFYTTRDFSVFRITREKS